MSGEQMNEFGEPKAPNRLFDDLYHFMNVHMQRYLAGKPTQEFSSVEESERVLMAIQKAWNEHIVPMGEQAQQMTAAEKTMLYEQVPVEFDLPPGSGNAPEGEATDDLSPEADAQATVESEQPPESTGTSEGEEPDEMTEEMKETVRLVDELFPYLAPGGGLMVPFATPLLAATGMEEARLLVIVRGGKPTREEIDLLGWGVRSVSAVFDALEDDDDEEDELDITAAVTIAMERLEEDAARRAVTEVVDLIESEGGGEEEEEDG